MSCLLVLLAASATFAQQDPLGSGKPSSYKLADLPSDLVGVELTTSGDNLQSLFRMSYFQPSMSNQVPGQADALSREYLIGLVDVIWTSKESAGGSADFVVGYKLDLRQMLMHQASIDSDSLQFRLTYVRRQAIVSMTPREDYSPTMLKVLASRKPAVEASQGDQMVTLSNIKQVCLAMLMFEGDYDDYFPYVESSPQLFDFLNPYTKNREVFKTRNPLGGEIRFNMSLAGANMTGVDQPAITPMFFESNAWPDGRRCVGFTDGHAKIVSADEWRGMQYLLQLKLKKRGNPIKPGAALPNFDPPKPPAKHKKGKG